MSFNRAKPSDYLSVLIAQKEELALPKEKQSEAVLQACESYLRLCEPPLFVTFTDKSQPVERD
jgi:hypothetical protein